MLQATKVMTYVWPYNKMSGPSYNKMTGVVTIRCHWTDRVVTKAIHGTNIHIWGIPPPHYMFYKFWGNKKQNKI